MSKTCVGLLCAVAIVLMCAPAATADPVRIVSYDVEQTAESGFGGWSHVYDGAVTDTGRRLGGSASCDPPRPPCRVVNETGGGGTLNDGVVSASLAANQLMTNRDDLEGVPVSPVITLRLEDPVDVQEIRLVGDAGPSIFSGAINAASVTIQGQKLRLRPPGSGSIDTLDLRGTTLAETATDTVVLSDFTAEWLPFFPSFDQFSISEIVIEAVSDSTPPVLTVPSGPVIAHATATDGAVVNFDATAVDETDGPVPVVCTPAAGSVFGIGETAVDCSAADAAGNVGSASFIVRVELTPAGVCALTHEYVEASSSYQQHPAAGDALAGAACRHLSRLDDTRAPRRAVIEAFEQAVDVLANRQLISAEQAATLADLVGLMPGARNEPTGETIQFREPLAGTLLFDPCGELLEISAGELAFVSHTRIDATGGFHFQGHAQFVGVEATSVDSGAAYHLRSQTHDAVYFDPIDGLPAVQVNRFRFVLQPAEGGAPTTLSARIHVTWTPGGDTPVVIIEDVQCEP